MSDIVRELTWRFVYGGTALIIAWLALGLVFMNWRIGYDQPFALSAGLIAKIVLGLIGCIAMGVFFFIALAWKRPWIIDF